MHAKENWFFFLPHGVCVHSACVALVRPITTDIARLWSVYVMYTGDMWPDEQLPMTLSNLQGRFISCEPLKCNSTNIIAAAAALTGSSKSDSHGSLGPHGAAHAQSIISIGSAVFDSLLVRPTQRHTDKLRYVRRL